MRNDSFLDNFASGSRSSASRSDLLKLPILTRSRPPENEFRKVSILCFKLMLVFL